MEGYDRVVWFERLEGVADMAALQVLCFWMHIEWENVAGVTKEEKIIGLLQHVERLNRVDDLARMAARRWPDAPWLKGEVRAGSPPPAYDAEFYHERAKAHYANQDYPSAIADLTHVIALDPANANTYHHRGVVYYDWRRYTEALTDYNRALDLNSKDATI